MLEMRLQQLIIFGLFIALGCHNRKNSQDIENSHLNSTGPSSYSSTQIDQSENKKFPDDRYCAEVDYYNPNTGTHSSYTLTVEVESNEITKIYFPNGGWLDNDHFQSAELGEDGTTIFTSDKGYEYVITIIGSSHNCFTDDVPISVKCKGETEEGDQCENMTDNSNGLCWQHQDQK